MSEFSADIVHAVVNFCYNVELELTIDAVGPILKCSDELGICIIVHHCLEFLSNITDENAIIIFSIAENYCLEEIREHALKHICQNFSKVTVELDLQMTRSIYFSHLAENPIRRGVDPYMSVWNLFPGLVTVTKIRTC